MFVMILKLKISNYILNFHLQIFLLFFLLFFDYNTQAQGVEELILLSEKPVDGMKYGNFSGMTKCRGNYYAVSDKDDKNIYKLVINDTDILAQKIKLPFFERKFLLKQSYLINNLDLEAISCDENGNLYIASETYSQVLKIDINNKATWIQYPDHLLKNLNKLGLLVKYNAGLEGIAIDAEGKNLWLIAERNNRGIIKLTYKNGNWECNNCVLLNENTDIKNPNNPNNNRILDHIKVSNDFSDAMWYMGKLFTLERNLHLVCRRDSNTASLEKCWSFAKSVLSFDKIYPFYRYGMAEALLIDDDATLWIGIDNNDLVRIDGEKRSIVFHYKPPKDGWMK